MACNKIIKVENLQKSYGSIAAVDNISFEVKQGEIFGMVGPNGAGKTTTIECLEGLRIPDNGSIQVLGLDPQKDGADLRHKIGVQLQESALFHRIKVWEALDLFASFYPRSTNWEELLSKFGLDDSRDKVYAKLSGGQKQRLFIALALINDPELIFLDELTTGLDPQARHIMWDMIREIRAQGKTICLTTHFMEEAERLCDRVAIIDRGKLVALDTPENLIKNLKVENRVIFTLKGDTKDSLNDLKQINNVKKIESNGDRIIVAGFGDKLVADVVNFLVKKNLPFRDLRTEQANLEDVFLALTGKKIID
jgi:ABC-2 type transport system ATP-binding protein